MSSPLRTVTMFILCAVYLGKNFGGQLVEELKQSPSTLMARHPVPAWP